MADVAHIIDRFIYHYGWAIVLIGILTYAQLWLGHKYPKLGRWLPSTFERSLITSALIVCVIAPMREWYDVWQKNQPWFKTPFDYASWFLGAGSGVWVFYRFYYWMVAYIKDKEK